jgi:hypothetical protein
VEVPEYAIESSSRSYLHKGYLDISLNLILARADFFILGDGASSPIEGEMEKQHVYRRHTPQSARVNPRNIMT